MTETALAPTEILPVPRGELLSDSEFTHLYRTAKALAAGRMFRDVTQADQAFSKMLVGYYLGLNPSQSMMGIHIVRGNVQMSYPTMGAFVKSRPGYDYKILEHDDDHAKIEFIKDGESLGTATFTVDDAKRAKLLRDDSGWKTYPENMCVARALSKGVRFFMPEALGGIPVYTTGEIPADELSSGDGSGEVRGVELPPEVVAVIDRARELDFAGWADVANWEFALDHEEKAPGTVAARIEEATAELDAREAERKAAPELDADVVGEEDDLPVEDDDLPEPPPLESASVGDGGAGPADAESPAPTSAKAEGSAEGAPVAPSEESLQIAVRLRAVAAKEPQDEAKAELRDQEIEYLTQELKSEGWTSAQIEGLIVGESPGQGSLI